MMITVLIIYLAFGIGISISNKTNIMANERWHLQLLYVVAYPVIIYIVAVKTARLAIKLTEMMDEQTTPKTANCFDKCTAEITKTEPESGSDMLESYAFDRLLYDHRKLGSDEAATAEEIKKFIRTYFSPYKSRS